MDLSNMTKRDYYYYMNVKMENMFQAIKWLISGIIYKCGEFQLNISLIVSFGPKRHNGETSGVNRPTS